MHLGRRQSLILAGAILTAFFVVGIWLIPSRREPMRTTSAVPTPPAAVTAQPAPDASVAAPDPNATSSSILALDQFHRVETREGKKIWEVRAKHGQYYPERNVVHIEEGSLWLFRKNNETIQIQAGSAELFLEGANLTRAEIKKNVRLEFNEKVRITTESAEYDVKADMIRAPNEVHIETDRLEVSGKRLEAKLESKEVTLLESVHTVVKPEQPAAAPVPAPSETPKS
jgi:LPS export ABC transporter protein LptC